MPGDGGVSEIAVTTVVIQAEPPKLRKFSDIVKAVASFLEEVMASKFSRAIMADTSCARKFVVSASRIADVSAVGVPVRSYGAPPSCFLAVAAVPLKKSAVIRFEGAKVAA